MILFNNDGLDLSGSGMRKISVASETLPKTGNALFLIDTALQSAGATKLNLLMYGYFITRMGVQDSVVFFNICSKNINVPIQTSHLFKKQHNDLLNRKPSFLQSPLNKLI